MSLAPNADRFPPLPPDRAEHWRGFLERQDGFFAAFVGLRVEEVRSDYARMRLPARPQLSQPAGVVHGGAIATLIDTVVVPAIAGAFTEPRPLLTITMQVSYLVGIPVAHDAIAEGWVEQRGKSIVFCRVEVRDAVTGRVAATGNLVYKIASRAA